MSERQLLGEEGAGRGSVSELTSDPELDSDSDWLSDSASRTRSPFQEEADPQSDSKVGLRRILSKVGRSSGSGRGSAGSVKVEDYKVYHWRWFMLATLSLLNLSNGMMWLTFAPIPNYTAVLYGVSLSQVDWLSLSYFVVSLLIGFVAIAILDIFGLRVSLYLGAGFNLTGSVLRWMSVSPPILCSPVFSQSGFLVAMVGQVLTACAQPFLLYAPTKLANLWFGPKERAFCTMLASLGNPVGLGMAQLISSHVVTSLNNFSILHLVYTAPALVGAVCAAVAYWRPTPPVPPAPSAAHNSYTPFLTGLKRALTTPSFLLLLVIWGCSSGLFNAMLTLLAQMLCPYGYPDRDSGLWGSLMIFSGLFGATGAGLLIDHFKLFKEVAVVSFSIALLCLIWFLEVFSLVNEGVNIAFSLCVFGFFALPLIPACMELGVEVTYPVSEATSSGLLWSMTQILGILFVLIGQLLQQDVVSATSACGVAAVPNSTSLHSTSLHCQLSNATWTEDQFAPMDFTYPLILYICMGFLSLVALAVLFRPRYRRLEMEGRATEILSRLEEDASTPASSIVSLPVTSRRHQRQPVKNAFIMNPNQKSDHSSTEF